MRSVLSVQNKYRLKYEKSKGKATVIEWYSEKMATRQIEK